MSVPLPFLPHPWQAARSLLQPLGVCAAGPALASSPEARSHLSPPPATLPGMLVASPGRGPTIVVATGTVSGRGPENVLTLVNLRGVPVSYPVPAALARTNWKNALDGQATSVQGTVSLQPYQYLILQTHPGKSGR